jgi:hypothetical protein
MTPPDLGLDAAERPPRITALNTKKELAEFEKNC